MEMTINNGRDESILGESNVSLVEKKYNATYVADLCLKNKDGGWINSPSAVFYCESPSKPEYSNYFAIILRNNPSSPKGAVQSFITDGASAVSEPIIGIVADDGEVVFSRYRHDSRVSKDGSVSIDGGRDYIKSNNHERLVEINIVDGKLMLKSPEKTPKLKS